jgi:hypothetical protein
LVGGRTFACEPNIRAATLIIKHVVAVPFPSSGFFAGSDAVWIFASDWSCRNEQIRLRDVRQTNPECIRNCFKFILETTQHNFGRNKKKNQLEAVKIQELKMQPTIHFPKKAGYFLEMYCGLLSQIRHYQS